MEQELFAAKVWFGVMLCIIIYGFFVLNASACRNATETKEISVFDVIGVLAENLGLLLRLAQRKKGYSAYMSAAEVFGVKSRHVCSDEAIALSNALLNYMRRRPFTYPASQRACVGQLARKFIKEVKDREGWTAAEERMRSAYDKYAETLKNSADWFKKASAEFDKSQNSFDEFYKQFNQARSGKHSQHQEQRKQQSAPNTASAAPGWRGVLGVSGNERDVSVIKRAYRKLALKFHPDRGGSDEVMARLNKAFAQARQELSFV